jgi:redox-sensitive bicupin YhaK (pirin superfamily)
MTAGSGIIHQEMPEGDGQGALEGFQLWLNLPAAEKMCTPQYRDVSATTIPVITQDDGIVIRIICGQLGNTSGPIHKITTDPEYLDVTIPANTSWQHQVRPGYTAIAYIIGGSGRFSPQSKQGLGNHTLVLFGDGEELAITAGSETLRFLLMIGRPLNEPIAWQGPIVMNTEEQLIEAFREFREGTFLRHKPKHTE